MIYTYNGDASDGGEFSSPSPLNNEDEGGEGNTGRARAPNERGSVGSEDVSEQALTERVQLTAEDIQTRELSNAPIGASRLQDGVGGQVAASAQERTTVPYVSPIPREIATGTTVMTEHHTYYDEIRSAEPGREYPEAQEPEHEVGPQIVV